MTKGKRFRGGDASSQTVRTRKWYAWNNLQPPKPYSFHVHGEVEVPNPGVEPILHRHSPQGIIPEILILDLVLVQRPGVWPRVVVWKNAQYGETLRDEGYARTDILCDGKVLKSLKVDNVH